MEWKISEGLVEYPAALEAMERRVQDILEGKAPEMVWLLEHPPLYTSGTGAKTADLLDNKRFPIYQTGRGGQWTYHGPGQRIAYVMLDLNKRGRDVRRYVRMLEQWLIGTLSHFGVEGVTREGRVGVWVEDTSGDESKIAALGIRVRKWVTFHGIALNVAPDLAHYKGIIPCGLSGYGVTSLKEQGVSTAMTQVDKVLQQSFVSAISAL